MRPNKLMMQAFGPFAGRETIDFDALGQNPLFLINGPTGSGKSSILDAICFALYGHTTGAEREPSQMRCDYAGPETLTEIELVFTLGDSRYRIRRIPTQERAKERGEGMTTQLTRASLYQLDGADDADDDEGEGKLLVPKSAQEVTRQIEELTGLNVEQFRQVMVLPQGKFREFLMADSSQRELIFSRLFQTHFYKRLEDALKIKAAEIRRKSEGLRHEIKGVLSSAEVEDEAQLQQAMEDLKTPLQEARQAKTKAQQTHSEAEQQWRAADQLGKSFATLQGLKDRLAELERQQADVNEQQQQLKQAQLAEKLTPLYNEMRRCERALKESRAQLEESKASQRERQQTLLTTETRWQQARDACQDLDERKAKLVEQRQWLPKQAQWQREQQQLKQTEAAVAKAQQQWQQAKDRQQQLKQQLLDAETRIPRLRDVIAALPELQRRQERLTEQGHQQAQWEKDQRQLDQLNQRLKDQEKQVDDIDQNYKNQQHELKQLELAWHTNQAALLAAELETGQPCPVCGSSEHPAPASAPPGQAVSREAIDQAREALQALQQRQMAAHGQLAELKANWGNQQSVVEDQNKRLGDAAVSAQELRNQYRELDQQIKTLNQQQEQLQQLEQQVAQLKEKTEQGAGEQERAQQVFYQAQQEHKVLQQSVVRLAEELPEAYRERETLKQSIDSLEKDIAKREGEMAAAQQALQADQNKLSEQKARVESLNQQAEQADQAHQEASRQWQQALVHSPFGDQGEYQQARLESEAMERLQTQIQTYFDERNRTQANLEQQEQQLAGQKPPDMERLSQLRDETKAALEQADTRWQSLTQQENHYLRLMKKLAEIRKDNEALEQTYKIYGTLADVATGQTGNKISLQRFVLSVLLDDVLMEASQRLQKMSKGRYQLLRKEDRAKGNKASGLELEVEDAYTGKTRSVATLSGGESFMAALSLALGLSDVVQAYAGGIRLDTLFIDEGFGSLDQESLDLAIRTLMDLQSTGRMIGIISHVSELKEQMALRLDLLPSNDGTQLRLVAPAYE